MTAKPKDAKDGWYVLIHQIPKRPLYLRAKVRNRLDRVGALSLKNSVYVLPSRADCLEDLQWVAQEVVAGGGDAFVCRATFVTGVTTARLVELFRERANELYEPLRSQIADAMGQKGRGDQTRLGRRFKEIRGVDFFNAPLGKEVQLMLHRLENRARGKDSARRTRAGIPRDLIGRTWVTRTDPGIDRLASAWLIRRFIDQGARFRFVDPVGGAKRADEISFDMAGGDFTHAGDSCTFEVLRRMLPSGNRGLDVMGQIVHDIDLKDEKYGGPDVAGVQSLIAGLIRMHKNDEKRVAQALPLLDALYASFERAEGWKPRRKAKPGARRG